MDLPQNRTARCRELPRTALALTHDLLFQAKMPVASVLGRKGDSVTAKRGSALLPPAGSPAQDPRRGQTAQGIRVNTVSVTSA